MSTLKNLTAAVIAAGTLVAVPAMAEVSGNVGLASNYVFRGVSLSNDQAAISGGVDYAHGDGVYVGTWVSNIDDGTTGTTELDLYAGFAGEAGDFGYDIGYIQYMYPEDAAGLSDYGEVYGSVSYSALEVGFAYTVNSQTNAFSDQSGDTKIPVAFVEGDVYFYLSAGTDLSEDWALSATVGSYTFEDDGILGADFDYLHGQIDLSKSAGDMGDFTFSLSITDADETHAFASDDVIPFVSWSKGF